MDNENTYHRPFIDENVDVLILVLMDNENTILFNFKYY